MPPIALVGAGVIGSSWSFVFARAGFDVLVYDAHPGSAAKAVDFVRSALTDLESARPCFDGKSGCNPRSHKADAST